MSYVPVSIFSPDDPIDDDRLNRIISNQQWLRNNTLGFRYTAYTVTRTEGMRIAVGVFDGTHSVNRQRTRSVDTGTFFTPGSRPIGLASVSTTSNDATFIHICARGGAVPHLDSTGMDITIKNHSPVPLTPQHIMNFALIGY